MRTNKLWHTPGVTLDDLQSTVDKLDALMTKASGAGRKVRSPRSLEPCFVSHSPKEGVYRVSFGTGDAGAWLSRNHAVVYEYSPASVLECEYDKQRYPATSTGVACDHISAVLNYRKQSEGGN